MREHRQYPCVDPIGLARHRRQPLDPLRVGDQHIPPQLLERVVNEPRALSTAICFSPTTAMVSPHCGHGFSPRAAMVLPTASGAGGVQVRGFTPLPAVA